MGVFEVTLLLATLLCSLVAGFLFAFAVVVMPGIRRLSDGAFIRAFQVVDGVIQDNQPLFMLVWLGSVVLLIAALALGLGQLDTAGRALVIVAALIYVFAVQLPTITINVPLNNRLQTLDVEAMDVSEHESARQAFEPRWNRWNNIRTALSTLVSALLIIQLFRM